MSTRPAGTLSIAATFTADPLLPSLRFMLEQAGLTLELQLAPYHQVFQELLSASSLVGNAAQGINLLLIRLEDFIREEKDARTAAKIIEQTSRELGEALVAFAARAKIPSIVCLFSPTSRTHDLTQHIRIASDRI